MLAHQVLSAPSYPWIFMASIPWVIKTFGFDKTLLCITKIDECKTQKKYHCCKGFEKSKMSDGMKLKLVPQRIVPLMSLVVTQVTTEHEDLT